MFYEFHDIPSAAQAMVGLELHYSQLQAGPAKVDIDFQQVGEVTVAEARLDRRAGGHGRVAEGQTLFFLCTHGSSAHLYNGLPLLPGGLCVMRGGVWGQQTLQPGFGGIHFLLPDELLRQHQRLDPVSTLKGCSVVPTCDPDRSMLLTLQTECGQTAPAQARHMADRIVSALCEISTLEKVSDLPFHLHHRTTLARKVRDLLENRPEWTLGDVCSELVVSERTARRAFAECFGMGPRQYQLMLRLNRVREALCHCPPDHGAISRVATQHGFWHMGRFSTQYRRLFGETAKATLRQACHDRRVYLGYRPSINERNRDLAKNG